MREGVGPAGVDADESWAAVACGSFGEIGERVDMWNAGSEEGVERMVMYRSRRACATSKRGYQEESTT